MKKRHRSPETERKFFDIEFKAVAGNNGRIEGYLATFGNIDHGGDVFEKGAFTKTISERIGKGLVPLLDSHQYDCAHVIGTIVEAREDEVGLWIAAEISSAASAQETRTKALEGHIKKMSVGFDSLRDSWSKEADGRSIRHIYEARIWEGSLVPLPMNEEASVTLAKGVVPFQDLDIADREKPWDADGALSRVRSWAGGGTDISSMNWTKYRRAFVWYDQEDPEQAGSYKLPIADIIDGAPVAIPRAIQAAGAVLQGARGGVDLPEEDTMKAKRHLERYYERMKSEFDDDSIIAPWLQKSVDSTLLDHHLGDEMDVPTISEMILRLLSTLSEEQRQEVLDSLEAGPVKPPTSTEGQKANAYSERRARLMEFDASNLMRRMS